MPAAWPVLPLGTMINQQNTPDDQASAQRLGHRDPLLTAPSSCTPNTKYQGFTRWGRTAEPPRGVPQGGHPGTRSYVAELLSWSQDMPKSQSGQEE